jgi:hypothetical protein
MGQRYKKCPFLKILSALIMKSIIAFFFIFAINNIDKNLSGKSDKIEVKKCKSRFFTLHSSFFIL